MTVGANHVMLVYGGADTRMYMWAGGDPDKIVHDDA